MVQIELICEPKRGEISTEIIEIPDEEWAAMTEAQRHERCTQWAIEFQQEVAPCGYQVIGE